MDSRDIVFTNTVLFSLSLLPIYFGAHNSLNPSDVVESVSAKDAWLFPVLGSTVLFSLYLLFKFLPAYWINLVMTFYFMFFGAISIASMLDPYIKKILMNYFGMKKEKLEKPTISIKNSYIDLELRLPMILGSGVGFFVGIVYFLSGKHWILNNILSESFAVLSIELLSVGSFSVASILLIGLFFYDIFWVFGTDVMQTVATKFDAPVKIVCPKIFSNAGVSLIGLGDIVIPGIFIAFVLRFDKYLGDIYATLKKNKNSNGPFSDKDKESVLKIKRTELVPGKNKKLYFHVVFVAYILALITTVAVMLISKHGQPALLYLVPACLGSVLGMSIFRGEIGILFKYKDSEEEEEAAAEKKDNVAAKKEVKSE